MPKILVVEDDPVNIETVVEFLEMNGHEPIVTDDGEQAIRMAQEQSPALVLMDANLDTGSAIDGWEASRRLKADPQTRGIPIIFLTASGDANARMNAEKSGCDDFVTKPFKFTTLIEKINALLRT